MRPVPGRTEPLVGAGRRRTDRVVGLARAVAASFVVLGALVASAGMAQATPLPQAAPATALGGGSVHLQQHHQPASLLAAPASNSAHPTVVHRGWQPATVGELLFAAALCAIATVAVGGAVSRRRLATVLPPLRGPPSLLFTR